MSRTNKDRYNPVPHDHEAAGHRIMSTPEGRQAWADASEEFAIIDAMLEAVEKSGLSQAELADRMGTTQSSISRMLHGGRSPSWKTASRLFRAAGFTVERIKLKKDIMPV